jgi:hypothetical protein
LFSIIMLSATQIFKMITDSQRSALAAQNVQDNIRYVFETMSKEIRDARLYDGGCGAGYQIVPLTTNKVFNIKSGALYFTNKYGECVIYQLDAATNRLQITRKGLPGFITPDEIKINNLNFQIKDELSGSHPFPGTQALVVINLDAQNTNVGAKQSIKMQTTVSARYYE